MRALKTPERAIKNGEPRDTVNIGLKKTQKEDKQSNKHNTETKMTSHTDSTKTTGMNSGAREG